jgi:outer membrane biosynthesis protein TonB
MRVGLTISAIGHAAVLAWGLVSFAPKALDAAPTESMPIDIISSTEFSQLRAGSRTAPKAETPKPLVEKVAEARPPTNSAQKVVDRPEIVSAFASQPPTPPEPKVPDPKRTPPPLPAEAKREPKRKDAEKKDPDPKPDPIAEAIKRDEAKKPDLKPEPKKVEAKKPEPKHPQPKFDATRIAALLDKREPQRHAAAGDTISHTPTLGTATGSAPKLSQSEIDALRARLRDCWSPPAGAPNADKLKVPIVIRFKQDGTLAGPPEPENTPRDAYSQAMVDSAVRATIRCQPYTMLSPAKYETWKEIMVDFSLDGMFGG